MATSPILSPYHPLAYRLCRRRREGDVTIVCTVWQYGSLTTSMDSEAGLYVRLTAQEYASAPTENSITSGKNSQILLMPCHTIDGGVSLSLWHHTCTLSFAMDQELENYLSRQ